MDGFAVRAWRAIEGELPNLKSSKRREGYTSRPRVPGQLLKSSPAREAAFQTSIANLRKTDAAPPAPAARIPVIEFIFRVVFIFVVYAV